MCKERKYVSYKVVATYSNGDKEEVKYNGINSSYKEMLQVYRDFKNTCGVDVDKIEFTGVTKNGELGIIFESKIKKQDLNNMEYNPMEDVLRGLTFIKNNPMKKYKNILDFYNATDKEYLHELENIRNMDISDKEKDLNRIDLINRMDKAREYRRKMVDRRRAMSNLEDKINCEKLDKLIKLFKLCNDSWTGILSCNSKAISEYERKNKHYELKYNSFEERDKIMEMLEKDKWKIIVDLGNGYVGYRGMNKDIEDPTYSKIFKVKRELNNIKTINITDKVPQELGSCIEIKYDNNIKQRQHIIHNLSGKYDSHIIDKEKCVVRFINRIA